MVEVSADAAALNARARGNNARIAEKLAQVLDGSLPPEEMDARLAEPIT